MKLWIASILCVATIAVAPVNASAQANDPILRCDSLNQCLAYVESPDCENPDDCVGLPIDSQKGYFSLPDAFAKFGRPAVPRLLELLSAKDLGVQSKAAYLLSESHDLQPEDLSVIVKAWDAGNVWARDAITKLGGREVAEKALRELRAQPDYAGRVRVVDQTFELEERPKELIKAFAKEKPELIRPVLTCWKSDACDTKLFERVTTLLMEHIHADKTPTIPFSEVYIDILTQPAKQATKRPYLLFALNAGRYLGEPTTQLRDSVSTYVDSTDAEIHSTTISLLAFWKDKRSMAGLLDEAKSKTGWEKDLQLSLVGQLGEAAKEAAPEIAEYLKDDWDTRAEAASVLGQIGAKEKVQTLAALITDADWFLSYRVVESLAKLDPGDKTGKRKEIAKNYWHPAVRDIANRSLNGKIEEDSQKHFMPSPTYDYCSSLVPAAERPDPQDSLAKAQQKSEEAQHEYEQQISAVHEFDAAELATNQKTIDSDILRGTDHGEFGGELSVISTGKNYVIFKDNINAVVRTSRGIFAVNSLSHMFTDYGYLLELRYENGRWTARKTFRLQGGIYQVYQAGDKLMFIGSGASMWLDEDLKPHWIACA
jgi:HEAT repeat protein